VFTYLKNSAGHIGYVSSLFARACSHNRVKLFRWPPNARFCTLSTERSLFTKQTVSALVTRVVIRGVIHVKLCISKGKKVKVKVAL